MRRETRGRPQRDNFYGTVIGSQVSRWAASLWKWRCGVWRGRRWGTDGSPAACRRPLLHCGAQPHSRAHDLGIELGNGPARGEGRGARARGPPGDGDAPSCTAPLPPSFRHRRCPSPTYRIQSTDSCLQLYNAEIFLMPASIYLIVTGRFRCLIYFLRHTEVL